MRPTTWSVRPHGSRVVGGRAVGCHATRSISTESGASAKAYLVAWRIWRAVETDVGTERRLSLLRGANGWKEYVAALEACNESWLDEGYGWSVLGTTHSYVHTITEARVRRSVEALDRNAAATCGHAAGIA